MDNLIQFEGGDVFANLEDRTITGLLLPYNEIGQTNIGRFMVTAGAIELPEDPAVVGLNLDHERSQPIGRATRVWEEPAGIMATFAIAKGKDGDAALSDPTRPALSAEFHATIKAGKAIAGRLWGAGKVARGAFASAMVLAADTTMPAPDAPAVDPAPTDLVPDADGHLTVTQAVDPLPVDVTVNTPAGESATYTPAATPAAVNPEGVSIVTASAAPAGVTPATIATTLIPGTEVLATAAPTTTEPRPVDKRAVFAAISDLRTNPSNRDAEQVLASLTEIKFSGSDALPGSGVLQPNWLGNIDSGSYVREYIELGKHGTDITATGKSGYKVKRGTAGSPIAGPDGIPNGGNWDGNKTEINSYNGRSEVATSSLRKFAVGNDIAREFYDLPGGAQVVEDFLNLLQEDYMYWSDMWSLYDLISTPGAPVAAATYPTDYPAAVGMLIQGILAVKKRKSDGRRDIPTFAIANDEAYAALAYAAGGADHLPAFVNLAISTASKGTVDGNVAIVQGDNGITGSASVTVGAQTGIDFDELPGGPLVVNALELARGGVDRAVHGYLQTFKRRAEAFVTIGTAETRANSTAYPLGRLIKVSAVVYRVVTAGTSASSAPTAPAVGSTVADGTATLLRLV